MQTTVEQILERRDEPEDWPLTVRDAHRRLPVNALGEAIVFRVLEQHLAGTRALRVYVVCPICGQVHDVPLPRADEVRRQPRLCVNPDGPKNAGYTTPDAALYFESRPVLAVESASSCPVDAHRRSMLDYLCGRWIEVDAGQVICEPREWRVWSGTPFPPTWCCGADRLVYRFDRKLNPWAGSGQTRERWSYGLAGGVDGR